MLDDDDDDDDDGDHYRAKNQRRESAAFVTNENRLMHILLNFRHLTTVRKYRQHRPRFLINELFFRQGY